MQHIQLIINGKQHTLVTDPVRRLIDVLREELYLTGVKEGCGIGECGACTVLLDNEPVNACLIMVGQAQGSQITTIEGIQKENGELHPLQEAFIEAGAVQCGFCTPGMVLSSVALLRRTNDPTPQQIKTAISGNMCRCTGYKQIVEAVQQAVEAPHSDKRQ